MASYRIHRIKDAPGENFRWTAHTGGLTVVKPKDYELDRDIQAPTLYGAWKILASEGYPLRPGDLLESVLADGTTGQLNIAKYIGFEPAAWWVPEAKPSVELAAVSAAPLEVAPPNVAGHQN